MDIASISTSSETQNDQQKTQNSENLSLNEDVREIARAQLDNAGTINEATGQLDFTQVLRKKNNSVESSEKTAKGNKLEQQDFRSVLKSKQNNSNKNENNQGVQQIDFRNMLKNKVNTKTQNEHSTRAQNATQIDFRDNLKKKTHEVTK